MSAGSQTLTLEVKKKFLSGWKKPKWPDPQNSIDFSCGTLGGVSCWTVKGNAKIVFAEIADDIKNLLQDRMDDIAECQHSLETFGWCMYMMGRDESHAEPVLLFECLDGKTRVKIVDIVKKSQLWKDITKKHPALRLASSSRGPQGSCATMDMTRKSDASNAVYCDGPLHQLYGVQIYVNSSQSSSPPSFRKATLGGLILIDDFLHAMTVAHLFKDTSEPQTCLEEYGDDFRFEDDNEMDDNIFIDVTSRGSESPKSTHSNLDYSDSPMESESNSSNNYNSLTRASLLADTNLINTGPNPPAKASVKTHLGSMKAMSNNTLDWAIVSVGEEHENLTTSVVVTTEDGDVPLDISKIVHSELISDEIWAITTSNGPVKGLLSTVPYYLKSSGFKTFQKTWMAYLEADVATGASGTWIIDRKTHELIGHVVARQSGSGLAYVVSASLIKNDIESRLGCNFSLPIPRNNESLELLEDWSTMTLHQAAIEGNNDVIKHILEKGADIESIVLGCTALHIAATEGQVGVVQKLLEKGAQTETKDESFYGRTALHLAAQKGHTGVILHLLEYGANTEAKERIYDTIALHLAAGKGLANIVQILLERGANINTEDADGRTALHLAAKKGHSNIVSILVEKGANIDAEDRFKLTALHLAARSGYANVIQLLVQHGAIIDTKDQYGTTALDYAFKGGHDNVVRALVDGCDDIECKNNNSRKAFCKAVPRRLTRRDGLSPERGASMDVNSFAGSNSANSAVETDDITKRIEAATLASENEHHHQTTSLSDPSERSASVDGWTPLNLAANNGHIEVVKLLIEHGADITVANVDGWTPLISAANNGHFEIVKFLIENGADITRASVDERTPLNMAAINGHFEIVRFLTENGANINVASIDEWTPSHSAVYHNHFEMIKFLIESGANFNVANVDGWTPLNLAAYDGHFKIVRLLIEKGADITVASVDGWTSLNMAIANGHFEIVKYLIENGADLNVASFDGCTPLISAINHGHVEIVQLLIEKGADITVVNKITPSFEKRLKTRQKTSPPKIIHYIRPSERDTKAKPNHPLEPTKTSTPEEPTHGRQTPPPCH